MQQDRGDEIPGVPDRLVPRPPATPRTAQRIAAQNRRREWLDQNPAYFDDPEHQFADLDLYARLIKAFQTPSERHAAAHVKAFARILEAEAVRAQERVARGVTPFRPYYIWGTDGADGNNGNGNDGTSGTNDQDRARTGLLTGIGHAWDDEPSNRAHGRELWNSFLKERFIRGLDHDFDYDSIDDDSLIDLTAEREAQDRWFDDEEPAWLGDSRDGETGVQDF